MIDTKLISGLKTTKYKEFQMSKGELIVQPKLYPLEKPQSTEINGINEILESDDTYIGDTMVFEKNIHNLAKINPLMSYVEFEALKHSIRQNGLLEPILLYQSKVIDGRNRINALRALGVKEVLYKKIKNNTPMNLVEKLVIIKETRRKQSSTQLAITALICILSGIYTTHKEAAIAIGVSPKQIQRAKQVAEYLSEDEMNALHAGGVYTTRFDEATSSLQKILEDCQDRENMSRVQPLLEVNFDADIKSSDDFAKAEKLIEVISCENLQVQIYCKKMLDDKLFKESGQLST